ncbi:MAG: amidohydrolase family protein [Phycisphaeraceae bacterium]|nr:amidohydrolase family protein [Phycisphaeraceae bacterium]
MTHQAAGTTPAKGNLREAHVHLLALGLSQTFVDLSRCTSGEEMLDAMARARPTASGWVVGTGARPAAWREPEWPTLTRFDEAMGGRPAVAWCFDYHALMAGSAAMAAAGITPESADPPGGVIVRDRGGKLRGVLLERAAYLAWSAVPEPTVTERSGMVLQALELLRRLGYVEAHDLLSEPWLGCVLAELDDAGTLPLDVRLFPRIEDAESIVKGRTAWERERVQLGGVKIFADGTLNSRTAWMLAPFADAMPEHPRGTPMLSASQLVEAVSRADALSLPLATHAIGDAAVRAVLDAIEQVRPSTQGFRIEHAEVIDEADVPRFARLGVICSVQPCHLLADIEALERSLPHRLDRVLPLRELVDSGCAPGEGLIFGSDAPIVRADPGDSILAATLRGRSGGGMRIAPEQAISSAEAWACFGVASARG